MVAFPHDLLGLRDWRWQGPVREDGARGKEGDGRAINVPSAEADTATIERYSHEPWFVLVADVEVPHLRLRSQAKGSTTSTRPSATTRSELREMHHPQLGRRAAWDAGGSTVHNLKVRLSVTKVMEKDGRPSRVAVVQVHKTTEDGILVYFDGATGRLRWKQDSRVQPGSLGDCTLGGYVNIGLSVRDGRCTIYVDDVAKAEGELTGSSAKTCYFKTGCYNQDNSRADGYPDDAVNEVRIAAVRVQHGVPWAPGGYGPAGPGGCSYVK
jgi:hypothetical protein